MHKILFLLLQLRIFYDTIVRLETEYRFFYAYFGKTNLKYKTNYKESGKLWSCPESEWSLSC